MRDSGTAMLGVGVASGKGRAREAADAATSAPLIERSIERATGVVYNITGGRDMTLAEVNEVSQVVSSLADPSANVIFGAVRDFFFRAVFPFFSSFLRSSELARALSLSLFLFALLTNTENEPGKKIRSSTTPTRESSMSPSSRPASRLRSRTRCLPTAPRARPAAGRETLLSLPLPLTLAPRAGGLSRRRARGRCGVERARFCFSFETFFFPQKKARSSKRKKGTRFSRSFLFFSSFLERGSARKLFSSRQLLLFS
jgi:hypothetical protein